jgi:hypothetical protein
MNNNNQVKQKLLMAMYKSVERQNRHMLNSNHLSAEAEKWLQVNLRHNFNEVSK